MLDTIEAERDATLNAVPSLVFLIGPGNLDENGELTGELASSFVDNSGTTQSFETGTYYGVIAGDNADDIAGVFVVTSQPEPNVTARETGGFIVYR